MEAKIFSSSEVEELRRKYPNGTRVKLLQELVDDPYSKLRCGDMGTVDFVDDSGSIHMRWDCGSSLALLPDLDRFSVIAEK